VSVCACSERLCLYHISQKNAYIMEISMSLDAKPDTPESK
jgi:hypothetical protein